MAEKILCITLVVLTLIMLAIAALTVPDSSKRGSGDRDIPGRTAVP
jgi:hypothetical protein